MLQNGHKTDSICRPKPLMQRSSPEELQTLSAGYWGRDRWVSSSRERERAHTPPPAEVYQQSYPFTNKDKGYQKNWAQETLFYIAFIVERASEENDRGRRTRPIHRHAIIAYSTHSLLFSQGP